MPFAPGSRLGPFEIIWALDVRGIGEAYRARDHGHGRDVAIRVLKADFVACPGGRTQFEQEARDALLSHPNIVAVHGIGTDATAAYVVSEPIEGTTLRDVLSGGALPFKTAVQYAAQIARGLAAAHGQGIVHRDLRPENLLVSTDRRVRILGFGLASLTQTASALSEGRKGPVAVGSLAGSQSPALLGTPGYMSPEQVRGLRPDPRSDMFTFGVIVYEMLAGRRAFSGATPLETMMAVARSDPPRLRKIARQLRLVERCLSRDPALRPAASEAAAELEALSRGTATVANTVAAPSAVEINGDVAVAESRARTTPRARRFASTVAVIGALALAGALAPGATRMIEDAWLATVETRRAHVSSTPTATATVPDRPVWEFAVSPDGRRLALVADDPAGRRKLWIRSLTAAGEQPLAGTDDAAFPFWSSDSRFVAYLADGALRRIPADGGTPTAITDAAAASAGSWNDDDVIVLPRDAEGGPLYRIPAAGGAASAVTGLGSDEAAHVWPAFLPDSRRFLYTVLPEGEGEPSVHAGSLDSMTSRPVLVNASRAAIAEGYIIFLRNNALTVQPFDVERLETRGDPIQIGAGALPAPDTPVRAFSLSIAGILAYQTGLPSDPERSRLTWFDRSGMEVGMIGAPADYGDLSLSPDGAHVAVSLRRSGSDATDLVVIDVASGTVTPLTSDSADESSPVWSPDGRLIVYASTQQGSNDIYQKTIGSAGNQAVLATGEGQQIPYDWSLDGQYLLYQTDQPRIVAGGNFDLWARPLPGGRPFAYWKTVHAATRPKLSPDRRSVAYTSLEGGREEVYVMSFPRPEVRRRVSVRGGSWPRWRRDGRELFYVDRDGRLIAVPVNEESTPAGEEARPLFQLRTRPGRGYPYDISAEGTRILVNTAGEGEVARPITLVDWRGRRR